jgi:hypothetical protein
MASLLDVTATILTAARVARDNWREVAGFDLIGSSSSSSTTSTVRTAVAVTDFFGYGIITRKWKLFYYPQYNETLLFHRESDPSDRINRYDPINFKAEHFGPFHALSSSSSSSKKSLTGKQEEKEEEKGLLQRTEPPEDSVVGGVMLYSLLRWRSRLVSPKLKPEDMSRISRRRNRPYNMKGVVDTPWGIDAELGLLKDLEYFS